MKVIFIHHSRNLGGAPKSLSFLIDGLKKVTKYELTIYTPGEGPGNDFISKFHSDVRINKRIIPFHNSVVSSTNLRKKIRGFIGIFLAPFVIFSLRKENPNIIHLNSSCLVFYSVFIKVFMKNTKVVCHLREPLLDNMLSKIIIYCLRKYVDSIVAISDNEVPSTLSSVTHIISNPIYSFSNKPENQFNYQEYKNLPTFTYMARCNYENGIFDFIALADAIEKKGIDANFIIVGANKNDDPKVREISSKIKNLKMFDMTDDINTFIRKSSCLIVPFKVPHFSRTLIEFGLSGIPAIVYDVEPLNKIIKDNLNGFICYPDSVSLLNITVNIIKNTSDMSKVSINVFSEFSEKYCTQKSVESVINIYESLRLSE